MQKSIFRRVFSVTAIVLIMSFLIFGAVIGVYSQNQWVSEKNKLLTNNVRTISQLYSSSNFSASQSPQVIGTTEAIATIIDADIFIVDSSGNCTFTTVTQKQNKSKISNSIMKSAIEGECSYKGTLDGYFKDANYVVSYPIKANGYTSGVVFAASPMHDANMYLISVLKAIIFIGIAVMAIAFAFTYVISSKLTQPLRQMAVVVKKMENGDFSAKIPVKTKDEIGLLADAINKMSISLGELEGMRRNFISSVSHELKTPMTSISGFVDGILDGTIPQQEQTKYLHIVSDETKRLSRLVNSMLQLSRLESGTVKINKSPFNITDMIIQVMLSFEQKIESKNIEIKGLDEINAISLTADKDLVYQVVYNLVENAIKFTPQDGYIKVNVLSDKNMIKFSIENSGEGLERKELSKIFERFYKTDRSRSQDKTGMGFGLYIVKTIVGLHSGKITVGSVVGKFTRFEVTLPDTEVVAEIDKSADDKKE